MTIATTLRKARSFTARPIQASLHFAHLLFMRRGSLPDKLPRVPRHSLRAHVRTNECRGFTLIELLMVIAIIGILASIVMVSLNAARVHARDAQRASQAGEITKALELYYTNNGGYPTCQGAADSFCNLNLSGAALRVGQALTSSGFLSKIPDDPRFSYGSSLESYAYCAGSGSSVAPGYVLFVNLESIEGNGDTFDDLSHCAISRGTLDSQCLALANERPSCSTSF